MALTPEVAEALNEIRDAYDDATMTLVEDGDGGAFVTVDPIDPGEQYEPRETWIKFHITFQYPVADVYPHFVRPNLRIDRSDYPETQPLGEGSQVGAFTVHGEQTQAIQISRRSNHLNPATDTALVKLAKVHDWIRTRP